MDMNDVGGVVVNWLFEQTLHFDPSRLCCLCMRSAYSPKWRDIYTVYRSQDGVLRTLTTKGLAHDRVVCA